ncbi:hypothetical protein DV735_g1545, partial [Chaetothyriales sp. CBS 134920]
MNLPPSIFDLAFNPPPANPSSIFPSLTGSPLSVSQRSGPGPGQSSRDRPRLPSPRLFRGIFSHSNSGTNSQSTQSDARRLPLLRERTNVDLDPAQLAGAITRTSRAVESVQEAFQPRRSGRNRAVVDLTDTTPSDEERPHTQPRSRPDPDPDPGHSHSHFLSHATHPLDRPRQPQLPGGLQGLVEPIFGYHVRPLVIADSLHERDGLDSLARARLRRAHVSAPVHWISLPRPRNTEQEEREAVRRQRENHAAWQQTQARTRQLQKSANPTAEDAAAAATTSSTGEAAASTAATIPSTGEATASTAAATIATTIPSPPSCQSLSQPSCSPVEPASATAPLSSFDADSSTEQIDLTGVDSNSAVDAVLDQQRKDSFFSMRPVSTKENGRTRLTAYKCPVCMDTPVNATTTICGHLFCHQCIVETLQWSAKQRDGPGARRKCGMCPVCRKVLSIKDAPGAGRTLVPLELKFLTRKRKMSPSADDPKGKAKATDNGSPDNLPAGKRPKRETTAERLWESYINNDYA